jgi:glycosyl transferase family 2
MSAPPSLSIVVEWDNVHFTHEPHAREVLARLQRELDGIGEGVRKPVELILAYDGEEAEGAPLRRLAGEALAESGVRPVYLAAPGKRYYELKNAAAARAGGDLLVFVDSDVVPEPGWLGRLLDPFADRGIDVVGGNSYVDPSGLWGKTFALAWFFPLRSEEDTLRPATSFFANNVAFRRTTFARFPFPEAAGSSRGSCGLLAQALRSRGIAIQRATGAQVSHPPPQLVRAAAVRAVAQGRDRVLLRKLAREPGAIVPPQLATQTLRRFVADRRRVGLSLAELPLALSLATLYYGVAVAGALATLIRPGVMTRRFRL